MQTIQNMSPEIAEKDVVIVVCPALTTLHIGQLISRKTLPAILEENLSNLEEVAITPYNAVRHNHIIKHINPSYIKNHLTPQDFQIVH